MEMVFLPAFLLDNSRKIECLEILSSRIRPLVCHKQVSASSLHLGDQICDAVIVHLHSVNIN